jgi:signal transduction histidine kinase
MKVGPTRKQGTAFALYAVLLVLPTLVLGFLQWHHIVQERASELAQLPREAYAAALRFQGEMASQLDELIQAENGRGWDQYGLYYEPEPPTPEAEITLLRTSLTTLPRPNGVLAWFKFDLGDPERPDLEVFYGSDPPAPEQQEELRRAAGDLYRLFDRGWMRKPIALEPDDEQTPLSLRRIAAAQATPEDEDCVKAAAQMQYPREVHSVRGDMRLHFYREPDGTPRLIAHRYIAVEAQTDLPGTSPCFPDLARDRLIVQGFFIDPQWYFDVLPTLTAVRVLNDSRERLLREGETCCEGENAPHAGLQLVGDMGFRCESEADAAYQSVRIALDPTPIDRRYRERLWRFLGVATMLVLALGTGVVLLGRSVQRDLEQASRTENFVAAVTHELRTPLSAIKLHGEMLLDGWASDPAQQQEYYRRIVRETERLSTLVERVLEKARLSSGVASPVPGDLSEEVARHADKLHGWRTTQARDLEFELADDLPQVMLTPEGVASILVNLVENARKYAPADPAQPGVEPIRVVARAWGAGGAALEVLDRGPGIPDEERTRVFAAFYRVGNESTRTARGTGLGLHLVALHAASFGARAEVEPRPGGGSIFRIVFPRAADVT